MKSINFFTKTDITIGIGLFDSLAQEIKKMGYCSPLLISDSSLSQSEYFNTNIRRLIKPFPLSSHLINEKKGEPTYRYLESLKEKALENKPDSVIAIGGGSTLDLGKGIALLLTNNVPAISLKGFPDNVAQPLPLITVPSIFGSGSEVSFNAVFIDEDEGRKLGINSKKNFPVKTVMDPLLTMTAPIKSVTASAMDTLVHCVDSFGSPKRTPISRMLSVEAFHQTFNALLNLDLDKPQSRIHLAIGSVCAINALMNSGDGPTNGFAYYFGVKDQIPHGLAGGIFLKEVMSWNFNNGYKDYSDFSLKGSNIKDRNIKLFEDLDRLYSKLEIPTLSVYGYDSSSLDILADKVSNALSGSFSGNPLPFDDKSAKEVLKNLV